MAYVGIPQGLHWRLLFLASSNIHHEGYVLPCTCQLRGWSKEWRVLLAQKPTYYREEYETMLAISLISHDVNAGLLSVRIKGLCRATKAYDAEWLLSMFVIVRSRKLLATNIVLQSLQ